MKLNALKFGVAAAIAFAIIWLVCSLLVFLLPGAMMSMSGHMLHANLENMGWHLSLAGVLVGGIVWAIVAGITAWLTVAVYNRLL